MPGAKAAPSIKLTLPQRNALLRLRQLRADASGASKVPLPPAAAATQASLWRAVVGGQAVLTVGSVIAEDTVRRWSRRPPGPGAVFDAMQRTGIWHGVRLAAAGQRSLWRLGAAGQVMAHWKHHAAGARPLSVDAAEAEAAQQLFDGARRKTETCVEHTLALVDLLLSTGWYLWGISSPSRALEGRLAAGAEYLVGAAIGRLQGAVAARRQAAEARSDSLGQQAVEVLAESNAAGWQRWERNFWHQLRCSEGWRSLESLVGDFSGPAFALGFGLCRMAMNKAAMLALYTAPGLASPACMVGAGLVVTAWAGYRLYNAGRTLYTTHQALAQQTEQLAALVASQVREASIDLAAVKLSHADGPARLDDLLHALATGQPGLWRLSDEDGESAATLAALVQTAMGEAGQQLGPEGEQTVVVGDEGERCPWLPSSLAPCSRLVVVQDAGPEVAAQPHWQALGARQCVLLVAPVGGKDDDDASTASTATEQDAA